MQNIDTIIRTFTRLTNEPHTPLYTKIAFKLVKI